jgi:hypothetical protein
MRIEQGKGIDAQRMERLGLYYVVDIPVPGSSSGSGSGASHAQHAHQRHTFMHYVHGFQTQVKQLEAQGMLYVPEALGLKLPKYVEPYVPRRTLSSSPADVDAAYGLFSAPESLARMLGRRSKQTYQRRVVAFDRQQGARVKQARVYGRASVYGGRAGPGARRGGGLGGSSSGGGTGAGASGSAGTGSSSSSDVLLLGGEPQVEIDYANLVIRVPKVLLRRAVLHSKTRRAAPPSAAMTAMLASSVPPPSGSGGARRRRSKKQQGLFMGRPAGSVRGGGMPSYHHRRHHHHHHHTLLNDLSSAGGGGSDKHHAAPGGDAHKRLAFPPAEDDIVLTCVEN